MKKIDKTEHLKIIDLYSKNVSIKELAAKYKVTTVTIWGILKKNGVILRKRTWKLSLKNKNKMSKRFKSKHNPFWKHKHSINTKNNISISSLGRKAWNKNIPCKKETKEKLRQYRGSLASNWRGGKRSIYESLYSCFKYRQWRSDIFTRDNFVCQKCNQKGGKLEAHHIKQASLIIKEYNIKTIEEMIECEELWNINNGITLCKKCHSKKKKWKKT